MGKACFGPCYVIVFLANSQLANVQSAALPLGVWTQINGGIVTVPMTQTSPNDLFARAMCSGIGLHNVYLTI
jgi:hypothetical protein